MKILKKILKWFLYLLILPITYLIVSLILTEITIDRKNNTSISDNTIFLSTNGVHLEIILSKNDIDDDLLNGLIYSETDKYLSFGWGEENFYINTPTWNDLTFRNTFNAMFLKSTSLMHVTRYKQKQNHWVEIKVNKNELIKLNRYILHTFKKNETGNKILLKGKGFTQTDDFYRAKGSYSIFKTCNSWVNSVFKKSGLKSSLWTPFDFGLINKHKIQS